MSSARIIKYYRLFFGLLGASAILTEIIVLTGRGHFRPENFFSYFTIESNILAATVLLYGFVVGTTKRPSTRFQLIRGATVLYMLMTGIIFALLLAGIEDAVLTAVPWDNIVLHYIMPVVILLDWAIDTPKMSISLKKALVWLAFPLAYVAYSVIRGLFVGWYPYPFLDPTVRGYLPVLLTSILLAIGVSVTSWILCFTTRSQRK